MKIIRVILKKMRSTTSLRFYVQQVQQPTLPNQGLLSKNIDSNF